MGWRDLMGAPAEAEPPYTQNPHNPQNPRPPLNFGDIGDIGYMPPAPESEPVPILAAAVDNSGAVDNLEPTTHCPACGSPSFWRSPASPGWRCAYCAPRDRSRAEAFESVTLASGQWAPGTRPPIPEPVTVDELLAIHGPMIVGCRTRDVLAEADDGDLPELRDRVLLEAFAVALMADHQVRPLPAASLPPLERLALEIGDDAMELRRWLDQSAQGRRIRQRIEREAGAIDRCLLGLRADPDTGLHAVLVRVLEGHQDDDRTRQLQADERIQDDFGAWRTPTERDRIAAYDRHHWHCDRCIRAGRGYGDRCADGERLHAAMRAAS